VVYVGRYYPDFQTVIDRINATEVAARWGQAFRDTITTFTDEQGLNYTATEIYHQE
jgi:L-rhamnose mutarotase